MFRFCLATGRQHEIPTKAIFLVSYEKNECKNRTWGKNSSVQIEKANFKANLYLHKLRRNRGKQTAKPKNCLSNHTN